MQSKKQKLSKTQLEALSRVPLSGWTNAYRCMASMRTMDALVKKGFLDVNSAVPGAYFSPTVCIKYRRKRERINGQTQP